jgi:hypothetical protein
MLLTVPGCGGRIGGSLKLCTAILDLCGGLRVLEGVRGNDTAAIVSLRHVGVAVTSGGSAQVAHGDLSLGLSLTCGVRGSSLSIVEVARSLHDCKGVGARRFGLSE